MTHQFVEKQLAKSSFQASGNMSRITSIADFGYWHDNSSAKLKTCGELHDPK